MRQEGLRGVTNDVRWREKSTQAKTGTIIVRYGVRSKNKNEIEEATDGNRFAKGQRQVTAAPHECAHLFM